MPSQIVKECSKILAEKGWNLALAESATAGRLSSEFSMTSQSGKVLCGGIVCYDACVKETLLKVPPHIIEKYTPESAEVTQILAEETLKIFNSKVAVAITGLTAPGGSECEEKPLGTIFFHIITPNKSFGYREVFNGIPEQIVLLAIDKTAELILKNID